MTSAEQKVGAAGAGRLRERVAIVTGSASGIGAATAVEMAHEGASVVVADRNLDGARSVAEQIARNGGHAAPVEVDVSSEDQVEAMVADTDERFGRIDILHNNAAALDPELLARDIGPLDMDLEVWDTALRVNLTGTTLCCKHVLPVMLAQGDGSIINTSSGSSLAGDVMGARTASPRQVSTF